MTDTFTETEVIELMTRAFNLGFNKYEVVDAGLEGRETDTEIRWILELYKHKNRTNAKPT